MRSRSLDLLVRERRVRPPDIEAERGGTLDERAAGPAEPDDAEPCSAKPAQLAGRAPVPAPGAHVAVEHDDASEQGEDERERVVGDLLDAIVGHVADPDAAPLGLADVQMVEADAAGRDHAQRRQPLEVDRPHLRLGADEQSDDVVPGPRLATFFDGHAGSGQKGANPLGVVDVVTHDDARLGSYGHPPEVTITARGPSATVHEKEIEIRWNDLDPYGHVNHAVFLTYLEEVRDEWLSGLVGEEALGYVVARVEIDYRRELTQSDDRVTARIRLDSLGTSSVRTLEEIVGGDGATAAEAKAVLVACDAEHRPRPLTEVERAALAGA
jgi:acyl-CoA thioester hydrolase